MNNDRPQSAVFRSFACELIENGLGMRFQARGRSMIPTIQDGEILHVSPLNGSIPRIADIVLLRSAGELKAHRIIQRRGEFFVTRGDAGFDVDGEVPGDEILGIVVFKESRETGQFVRLDGWRSRLSFFVSEARRRMSAYRMR
jgi:hypothetical protein